MEKKYNPKNIEQELYKFWEHNGFFKCHFDISKKSFCIMIPPPNITGSLHMGHAFQQTIIDILIRYNRMVGKNTLCQVGTDHAGIATQMLVEKKIFTEEKKTRHDYGRELFLKKVWEWKQESNKNIKYQMRRLGISVDWDLERFTLDANMSLSVKEMFISLYEKKLIYQRNRLVNWDFKLGTVISDLEVEYHNKNTYLWKIKYPIVKNHNFKYNQKYLTVATTRPETLLGDVAIAVHPLDERYKNIIGGKVEIPLTGRRIPIIADNFVNIKKGTGCVKITPAHDFHDYEVAIRHNLPIIRIFSFTGNILSDPKLYDSDGKSVDNIDNIYIPKEFRNLNRLVARKQIVSYIRNLNLLESVQSHISSIPYGDRSGDIIEPMLTRQWYLRTKDLSTIAIKAVKDKKINFFPKKYENTYFAWMNNVKDWCLSRQLWWGHRIPVWYDSKKNIYVGRSESDVRTKYSLKSNIALIQDSNVLDTWFSSGIWTFSSLGWPNKTNLLKFFHPTNVLVSGFDIIFFWIARMIMLTMNTIKDQNNIAQVPFKDIYITGLIRDDEGQKMSKSKGNIIDPLDMIDGVSLKTLIFKRTNNMVVPKKKEKIIKQTKLLFPSGIEAMGTDALRFTCASLASTTRDINWSINRLQGYRNFCNKLWNASRFVLMNMEKDDKFSLCNHINQDKWTLADKWIQIEFNNTIRLYTDALKTYRFDLAANILYNFTWNKFCDWYLEIAKFSICNGSKLEKLVTKYILVNILESLLKLAHPIIPFITESIWQKIKLFKENPGKTIMLESFPKYDPSILDIDVLNDMTWIINILTDLRNIRRTMNIKRTVLLSLSLKGHTVQSNILIMKYKNYLKKIAYIKYIDKFSNSHDTLKKITRLVNNTELIICISDFFDKRVELDKLNRKIERNVLKIKQLEHILNCSNFLLRAPNNVIKDKKERLSNYKKLLNSFVVQKKTILDF